MLTRLPPIFPRSMAQFPATPEARMISTLILPGIGNSGPEHWQSIWERTGEGFQRVNQDEWEAPRCADWVRRLDEFIFPLEGPLTLVAHSSSCAMVVHWSRTCTPEAARKIRGALLVAPSDPEGPNYPKGPVGFAPVPLIALPFPSIVVASTNDQYVTLDKAAEYAAAWKSRLVVLEKAGHINAASGLGDWPEGLQLKRQLQDENGLHLNKR